MKMLVCTGSRPVIPAMLRRRSGGRPFEEPRVKTKMPYLKYN
jgi:hypothetical protein